VSTLNDILDRATELVQSLTELVESDTAQALPGVAADLGATDLLNAGVDALVSVLGMLHQTLADLGATAVTQLDAVGGLIGMLEPLVAALGRMIGGAGNELAGYGLDGVVEVTEPVSEGFLYAEAVLRVARNLAVDSVRFGALVDALDDLVAAFAALKVAA
jgi:hypothetical protein